VNECHFAKKICYLKVMAMDMRGTLGPWHKNLACRLVNYGFRLFNFQISL